MPDSVLNNGHTVCSREGRHIKQTVMNSSDNYKQLITAIATHSSERVEGTQGRLGGLSEITEFGFKV